MDENLKFKITQLIDSGHTIILSLSEDVELESVSQQQMILEAIDQEMKQQIKPLLEAILNAQPKTVIKTYNKTIIQITMPKRQYEMLNKPQVGELLQVNLKKLI